MIPIILVHCHHVIGVVLGHGCPKGYWHHHYGIPGRRWCRVYF